MANEKVKIRLQGHEKFVLREGWLNKGIVRIEICDSIQLQTTYQR